MDKKSKIFFIVFFVIVLAATGASFYKYFILKDYYIKVEVECDPEQEQCFMLEDEAVATTYYKIIKKKALDLPLCEADSPDCPPLACQAGEDCQEIFCDQATETEETPCSNLETF
ncbi:MAG: hypothetical protein AAB723_01460 [Patescibacteria group bacterium]